MDGQCFSCTENFGIFRREHGCKNCGFAFCSKCLTHSVVLPGHGAKEQNVCNKCYKQLTAPPSGDVSTEQAGYQDFQEPPENFKKRIAALASKKDGQATSTTSHSSASSSMKRGLGTAEDRDIAERLERLKADRKKLRGRTLSTEEIEEKLQKLKGSPAASTSTANISQTPHQPPDQRTRHEQSQDLLTQVREEVAIDAKMDGVETTEESPGVSAGSKEGDLEQDMQKLMQDAQEELKRDEKGLEHDAEIALRLAKLSTKNKTPGESGGPRGVEEMDVEEDEEEASRRLIQQLLEQDRLEARTGALGYTAQDRQPQPPAPAAQQPSHGEREADVDELPWCCICNEDAVLRCHGCDGDLYCQRCFREGHDGFDLKNHRTSNYSRPKERPR